MNWSTLSLVPTARDLTTSRPSFSKLSATGGRTVAHVRRFADPSGGSGVPRR
jgi:hypothetical protein